MVMFLIRTVLVALFAVTRSTAFVGPFRFGAASSGRSNRYVDESTGQKPLRELVRMAGASSGATDDDGFDMNDLKRRIQDVTNPYTGLFFERSDALPDNVYILLFEPGTEKQGVHTVEYPKGSGSNLILAFESKQACKKFALMLQKQMQFEPVPQKMTMSGLESFCEELGVFAQVVPKGTELIPPAKNVKKFGHKNPHLRREQRRLSNLFFTMDGGEEQDEGAVMVQEESADCWQ